MLTRRNLFRRAAQAAVAAPLLPTMLQSEAVAAPVLEPEPLATIGDFAIPWRPTGNGGAMVITAGTGGSPAAGGAVHVDPRYASQISEAGWAAFREGMERKAKDPR